MSLNLGGAAQYDILASAGLELPVLLSSAICIGSGEGLRGAQACVSRKGIVDSNILDFWASPIVWLPSPGFDMNPHD